MIENRFGMTAVRKGFITLSQLSEALHIQIQEEYENKDHRLVGSILVSMGALQPFQVESVLRDLEPLA